MALMNPIKINRRVKSSDAVCVIEAKNGKRYSGISLIVSANVGFCAEQAAIAEMIKDGETVIKRALVVDKFNHVFPPCGKCRELMSAISIENKDAEFYVSPTSMVTLRELLPYDWKDIKDNDILR
jgi:cytidine deaminase